jgi:hypothetical protein
MEDIVESRGLTADRFYLVYCFFEDFNRTRDHLKCLWTSYKHGAIDLTIVALSTNTAFELFKRVEKDLLENLQHTLPPDFEPRLQEYGEVVSFLRGIAARSNGLDAGRRMSPGDPYNFEFFEVTDWTGAHVHLILTWYMRHVKSGGQAPLFKPMES